MTSAPGDQLRGRVAVIAGDGGEVVPVCHRLLSYGVSLLVVAPDRDAVQRSVAEFSDPSLTVVPITADPASPEVWDRLVPHAEQRLGPVDIAIAIGPAAVRDLAYDRLIADMVRRGHGVFVECDSVFVESDSTAVAREVPGPIRYAALSRVGDAEAVTERIFTALT